MLNSLLSSVARDILAGVARPGGPSDEAVRLFWDLKYLARFGVPEVALTPDPEGPTPWPIPWPRPWPWPWPWPFPQPTPIPFPPPPWPGPRPSPIDDAILDAVLDGQLGFGDPSPQPSVFARVADTKIRRASAKALRDHMSKAIKELDAEIKRLG